jgi:hypothetical protein
MSLESPNNPGKHEKQTHSFQNTTDNENGKIDPGGPMVSQPAPPNDDSHHSHECCKKPSIGWRFLQGVALAAGILYAVVTCIQWYDLRKNFEADQRAWLQIGLEAATTLDELAKRSPDAIVGIAVKNVGKSPSLRSVLDVNLEVTDSHSAPSLKLEGILHNNSEISILFPNTQDMNGIPFPHTQNTAARKFTDAELSALRNGNSYLSAYGQIVYEDQFGRHWGRFCFWRDYEIPGSDTNHIFMSYPCVRWNAIGDGEPPKEQ